MSRTKQRQCPLFRDERLDDRWVAWRLEGGKGKGAKVPYDPRSGQRAKSNDPSTWATRQLAERFTRKSGIGIMLGDLGDGEALCGVDLDTCRDPETGIFEPWAEEIIERLDSYVEVSPSGTGAKIFFTCDADAKGEQNSQFGWRGSHPPAIDVFTSGRFFTVTEQNLGDRPLREVSRNKCRWIITQGRKLSHKPDSAHQSTRDQSDLGSILANRPLDITLADIKDVLDRLDHEEWCEHRQGWLNVGAALHHQFEGDAEGLELWDEFSRRSSKFDAKDNERTWRGFRSRPRPFTFRSLIKEVGGLATNTKNRADNQTARTFLTAEDLKKLPRPYDFVRGLLFDGQLSVVYGKPGSGKSFLVLDIASAVSYGQFWGDRQTDQRNVLIIPLEGLGTLADRIRAWEMARNRECRIIFSRESLDLRKGEAAVQEIIAYVASNDIGLVVIDTLARAMPGADENTSQDMSAAIRGADQIREATGAHVMLVHHSGKDGDRGARGHSSLTGAADLMVEVKKEAGARTATVVKNRSGIEGAAISFTLETVQTDLTDVRGDPISAAVVSVMHERFADLDSGRPKKLTADEERLLRTACLLTRHADIFDYEGGLIPRDDLKRQVYGSDWRTKDRPDTKKRLYNRAKRSLVEKHGLLEEHGDRLKVAPSLAGTAGTRRDKSSRPAFH